MNDQENPYTLLKLPVDATEEQIRAAFASLSAQTKDPEERDQLIRAYGMIRDEKARRKLRWERADLLVSSFATSKKLSAVEVESLAYELAFLSEWELGADLQLKNR